MRPTYGARTLLVAVLERPDQVPAALADGADLIDVTAWDQATRAAAGAHHGGLAWDGDAADVVDIDTADGAGAPAPVAWVVAAAAVAAWQGAAMVRTAHVAPVRRAVDMAAAVRGDRLPALTVRGLA